MFQELQVFLITCEKFTFIYHFLLFHWGWHYFMSIWLGRLQMKVLYGRIRGKAGMRLLCIDLITHFKDEIILSINCKHFHLAPIKLVLVPFILSSEPGFRYIYSILRTCILQKWTFKAESLLISPSALKDKEKPRPPPNPLKLVPA